MKIDIEGAAAEETIYFRVKKTSYGEIHLVGRRENDKSYHGYIIAVVTADLKSYINSMGASHLGIEVRNAL